MIHVQPKKRQGNWDWSSCHFHPSSPFDFSKRCLRWETLTFTQYYFRFLVKKLFFTSAVQWVSSFFTLHVFCILLLQHQHNHQHHHLHDNHFFCCCSWISWLLPKSFLDFFLTFVACLEVFFSQSKSWIKSAEVSLFPFSISSVIFFLSRREGITWERRVQRKFQRPFKFNWLQYRIFLSLYFSSF